MSGGLTPVLALIIDHAFGDPPNRWHPVVAIGKLIAALDTALYPVGGSDRRKFVSGAVLVAMVLATCCGVAHAVMALVGGTLLELPVAALMLSLTITPRTLARDATEIRDLLVAGNLAEARRKVGWIVGRDTDRLTPSEVARAVVETVAENTIDGIISPLFWYCVGSATPLGGVPMAVLYRAANTMDSMVGYTSERYLYFGRCAAKFDDIMNYIPARITGILLVMAAYFLRLDYGAAWRTLRRDAHKHPSPNGGWAEATVAGALHVQLGGVNYYGGLPESRAVMGDPDVAIDPSHITQTVQLMRGATWLFAGLTTALWAVLMSAWLAVALLKFG